MINFAQHAISTVRQVSICLLAFSTLASAAVAAPTTLQLKDERVNDLAIWNLGNDSTSEVFITTLTGKTYCFGTAELDEIWSVSLTSEALTAPVIGDFLGTGAPILAFASISGEIYFLWPGSGEIIARHKTSYSFSIAPSVATFSAENKDYIVFPDDTGQLIVFALSTDAAVREAYKIPNTPPAGSAFSTMGRTAFSAACDDLNHDGTPELITVTNTGVLQVASLTQPPTRAVTRLAQDTQPTTLISAAPLVPGENNVIALGVKASLYLFQWNSSQGSAGSISPLFETPAFGNTLGHILMAPVNPDSLSDVIATAENVVSARYYGKGLDNSPALLDIAPQHLTTINLPFSPACPVLLANGQTGLVSADGKGNVLLWQPTAPDIKPVEIAAIPPTDRFTPGGNLLGDGKLTIVTWDPKSSTLSVVPTNTDIKPDSPPALTAGVNFARNGNWGKEWVEKSSSQVERAQAALTQARSAVSASPTDTDSALDAASILRGIAPADPAAAQYNTSKSKGGLLLFILGTLIALGLAAFGWLKFFHKST